MELYLLIVMIAKINKWLMKHDRQLYSKDEYEALKEESRLRPRHIRQTDHPIIDIPEFRRAPD
jgi:hypothetical protein